MSDDLKMLEGLEALALRVLRTVASDVAVVDVRWQESIVSYAEDWGLVRIRERDAKIDGPGETDYVWQIDAGPRAFAVQGRLEAAEAVCRELRRQWVGKHVEWEKLEGLLLAWREKGGEF